MNTFERDTIAEIKARVLAKQPVAKWEKQLVLDLLRREGVALTQHAYSVAASQGLNMEGIKVL